MISIDPISGLWVLTAFEWFGSVNVILCAIGMLVTLERVTA